MPTEETVFINAFPTPKEQVVSYAIAFGFTVVATAVVVGGIIAVGAIADKITDLKDRTKSLTK